MAHQRGETFHVYREGAREIKTKKGNEIKIKRAHDSEKSTTEFPLSTFDVCLAEERIQEYVNGVLFEGQKKERDWQKDTHYRTEMY